MHVKGLHIHRTWPQVEIYVDNVRAASDSNKHALGFVRAGMFEKYARANKLLVATGEDGKYAGHLLFDYSFPHAVVLQVYSAPEFRRQGVAKALVDDLKASLAKDGFMSIRASVAEDLLDSNKFWESAGFHISKRRFGGATTGRMILRRIHELDSPQLFERSGLTLRPENPLGLGTDGVPTTPAYLIDLNVVFDVTHRRSHASDAEKLLHASHSGECRVLISTEMSEELQRHAHDARNDPMLRLLISLPRVPAPKNESSIPEAPEIARAIFPDKTYPDGFSANDRSDIRHLITALQCGAAAFITRDQRILDAASYLEIRHGLQVLSPSQLWDFTSTPDRPFSAESGNDFLEVCTISDGSQNAHDLMRACGINAVDAATKWCSRADDLASTGIKLDGKLIALSVPGPWDVRTKARTLRMLIDENSALSSAAARLLLQHNCSAAAESKASQIRIEMPQEQHSLREAAYRLGFRQTSPGHMAKGILGRAVTPSNWSSERSHLETVFGITLPKEAPLWQSPTQLIEVRCADGERRHVALTELETLLSPALLCLPGRPASIAPIKPRFSEVLLGGHKQLSLAPRMEAETYGDRLFLCSPKLLGQFKRGGLLFFYQSGTKGAQAIIAVARIVDAFLIRRDEVNEESLRRSVLRVTSLSDIGSSKDKAACLFDNLIFMPQPVSLEALRTLGYQSTRLMSTGHVNAQQSLKILERGFSNV